MTELQYLENIDNSLQSINMYLQINTYILVIGSVALVVYLFYRLILSMFNFQFLQIFLEQIQVKLQI